MRAPYREIVIGQADNMNQVHQEEDAVPDEHVHHADEESGPEHEQEEGDQEKAAEEQEMVPETARGQQGDGSTQVGQLKERCICIVYMLFDAGRPRAQWCYNTKEWSVHSLVKCTRLANQRVVGHQISSQPWSQDSTVK